MQKCICEGVVKDCFTIKSKGGKEYRHIRVRSIIDDGEEDLCFQIDKDQKVCDVPVQISFEIRTLFTRCNTSSYTYLPVLSMCPLEQISLNERISTKLSNTVIVKDTVFELRKVHTVRNSHSVRMEFFTMGDLNDSRLPSVSIFKSPQYDWIKKWMLLEVEGTVKSCWNDNYPTPSISLYAFSVKRDSF